ncbi:MAG TPA: ureidoglycolate lyase [Vicinamibacterales bacterium]|nr:ureidoglycolate lyase [Vicinamibacterales bacterium]
MRIANARAGVHELKIEALTDDSFRPFGKLFDARARPVDRRTLIYDKGFDVVGKTIIGVIWQPFAGRTFAQLERHFNVTQAFIPMSGSLSVVAVAPPTDLNDREAVPRPDQVRAFLIDGTVGFRYKVGTWHSLNRYILHPPGATFVIVNVDPNPTQVVDYQKKFGITFKVVL